MSKRISYIQSLVSPETKVLYDLCCDHGKIGSPFTASKEVYFIDIVPSIINKLAKATDIPNAHFICEDCTNLNFILNKPKTIILAGIGGDLTIKILKNLLPQMNSQDELIISAHKNLNKVREFLKESALFIHNERIIYENNQFYQVFKLAFFGNNKITLYGDQQYKEENHQDQIAFLKNQIEFYKIKSKYESIYDDYLKNYKLILKKLL